MKVRNQPTLRRIKIYYYWTNVCTCLLSRHILRKARRWQSMKDNSRWKFMKRVVCTCLLGRYITCRNFGWFCTFIKPQLFFFDCHLLAFRNMYLPNKQVQTTLFINFQQELSFFDCHLLAFRNMYLPNKQVQTTLLIKLLSNTSLSELLLRYTWGFRYRFTLFN
jgi:hypothetical protein